MLFFSRVDHFSRFFKVAGLCVQETTSNDAPDRKHQLIGLMDGEVGGSQVCDFLLLCIRNKNVPSSYLV